jgi:hypothetical protein
MDMTVAKHKELTNLHEGAAKHSQADVVWATPTITCVPTRNGGIRATRQPRNTTMSKKKNKKINTRAEPTPMR